MDAKLSVGIAIIKELAKGRIWNLPDGYSIGMAEDYTIGFVMTKENGETSIGGLNDLTLKNIVKLAELHGVEAILPSDPERVIIRHAENLT